MPIHVLSRQLVLSLIRPLAGFFYPPPWDDGNLSEWRRTDETVDTGRYRAGG